MNTTYFLNLVAGNILKSQTSPAIPSNIYLGLSTTTPTVSGTGVTEPSSVAAYTRVLLTGKISTPTAGVCTNTTEINFPESTASWGTVTHYVIYDAATGGNLLMYGALSAARSVEPATIMTVKTGSLTLMAKNPS